MDLIGHSCRQWDSLPSTRRGCLSPPLPTPILTLHQLHEYISSGFCPGLCSGVLVLFHLYFGVSHPWGKKTPPLPLPPSQDNALLLLLLLLSFIPFASGFYFLPPFSRIDSQTSTIDSAAPHLHLHPPPAPCPQPYANQHAMISFPLPHHPR